jgi:tight adherence protein B
MGIVAVLFIIFVTVGLISYAIIPLAYGRLTTANVRRVNKYSANIEELITKQDAKKLSRFFLVAPFVFAIVLYIWSPNELKLTAAVVGAVAGIIFPNIYLSMLKRRIKNKFSDQLVDALMIMSSSFRGGLSLVQAFEAVVEEMPDPINKEFGMVLGENKMGVSLEEALYHLYNRMPSSAVQQMITAILLARETGGNLPVIFNRIVNNIRESKKIQQNIDTLTIQGRIQGVVMSLLPIAFGFVVYSANKRIFDHMLVSDLGRSLLVYAVISQAIGAFLIWRISTNKEY